MIVPSEPVLGRLPVTQVAGAVSYVEVRNDTQNGPLYGSVATDQQAAANTLSGGAGQSTDTSISAFPSLFLAQLMGQDSEDPQTQSIIASYEPQPQAGNARPAPGNRTASGAGPMGDFYKALQDIGNSSAATPTPAPPATSGGTPSMQQVPSTPVPVPQATAPATVYILPAERRGITGSTKSIVGSQAYRLTVERNASLDAAPPELSFA